MHVKSIASFLVRSLVAWCALASTAAAQFFPLPPNPPITVTGAIEADTGCGKVFVHDESGARYSLDTYFDEAQMVVAEVGDTVRVTGSIFQGLCVNVCNPTATCMLFVEIDVLASAPEVFCVGDGSPVACPCGNDADPAERSGCENSTGLGATLRFDGGAIVGADALVLLVADAPANQPALLVSGGSEIAVPFRDGLLCAGGPTDRVELLVLDANGAGATASDLAVEGGFSPGDEVVYQAWYRDPQVGACGTGSNWTNGLRVVWG